MFSDSAKVEPKKLREILRGQMILFSVVLRGRPSVLVLNNCGVNGKPEKATKEFMHLLELGTLGTDENV